MNRPIRAAARALRRAAHALSAPFGRSRFEREMDEEMRFHLEMEVEDRIRAGMSPAEARRTALRDFGGVDRFKEEARAARGLRLLDQLVQDLRFGWRVLRRRPGFSLVAVLTLAVGIGATTAVFSLADAVLFRPPAGVDDPDGLVQVRLRAPHLEDEEVGISYPSLVDVQEMSLPAVRRIVGWEGTTFQVAVPGRATTLLRGHAVLGDYFGALGVRSAAGRLFGPSETRIGRAEAVVVLSRGARERLFSAIPDEEVVGAPVSVNGVPLTVVGVAGDGFRGLGRDESADLWIPYGLSPRVRHASSEDRYLERGPSHLHDLIVRLAEDGTPEAAEIQLRQAFDRLASSYPEGAGHFADYRPTVYRHLGLSPWTASRLRVTMGILGAAVLLVLLVACANVANLLIFRGVRRRGESAVRRAMGASGPRLLRQHLTESVLLAGAGVLLGLAAPLGLAGLFRDAPPGGPILALDWRVAAFAAVTGAVAVLVAGLVPAWVVHRVDLVDSLKESHRTETGQKRTLRTGLTIVQLALSLTLVVGALLLARTVRNLHSVPLGFDTEGVVGVRIDLEPQGYDDAAADRFYRALLEEAPAMPGVQSVAAAGWGPLQATYSVDLRPGDAVTEEWPVEAYADYVSPDYFRTLGVELVRGRALSEGDLTASWDGASGVAVINRTLAGRLFGDEDPLGRTVVQRGYQENTALRVVGVVEDSRTRDLAGPTRPALYRPFGEKPTWTGISLLVRSARPPVEAIADVRALVDRLDPALPFYWARSLDETVRSRTVEQRLLARLMTVLAALAALLAGVGLYGVVAYSVAERTREIGIRMAMGAGRRTVIGMVVRQSLVLAGVGLVVGAGVAWLFARALEGRLFGVEPLDPATWLLALGAFALLALLAAVAPAASASRVEPMSTLKST